MAVRKSTVSAQSGYCEFPRKPSCSKNVRLPTMIANQRAQPARVSNPNPAKSTTIPQSSVIQPHVVPAADDRDQALEDVDASDDRHEATREADPPRPLCVPCHSAPLRVCSR